MTNFGNMMIHYAIILNNCIIQSILKFICQPYFIKYTYLHAYMTPNEAPMLLQAGVIPLRLFFVTLIPNEAPMLLQAGVIPLRLFFVTLIPNEAPMLLQAGVIIILNKS